MSHHFYHHCTINNSVVHVPDYNIIIYFYKTFEYRSIGTIIP